jgi:hypothetical protein
MKHLFALGHLSGACPVYFVEQRIALGQIFVTIKNTINTVANRAHIPAILTHDTFRKIFGKVRHARLKLLLFLRLPNEHMTGNIFNVTFDERCQ